MKQIAIIYELVYPYYLKNKSQFRKSKVIFAISAPGILQIRLKYEKQNFFFVELCYLSMLLLKYNF